MSVKHFSLDSLKLNETVRQTRGRRRRERALKRPELALKRQRPEHVLKRQTGNHVLNYPGATHHSGFFVPRFPSVTDPQTSPVSGNDNDVTLMS